MIKRNSAKCTACNVEIVSTHRHDFVVHYCDVEPTPEYVWADAECTHLVPSGKTTWRFAVDGGKAYLKRCGDRAFYTDTSEVIDEEVHS